MRISNKRRFNNSIKTIIVLTLFLIFAMQPKATTTYKEYTVGTDENLYQIIHTLYDTNKEDYRNIQSEITRVNNINPNLIRPGQTLRIPQEGLK